MKRIFQILFVVLNLSVYAVAVSAQSTDRDYLRLGNKYFHKGEYDKALTNYTKALEKKKSVEAYYNYAGASLVLRQDSTANANYIMADSLGFTNPLKRAKNYHNLGNLWYMQGVQQMRSNGKDAGKAFQNAINCYKTALRCNPKDDETRYNLAMAIHQLKKSNNSNSNGGGGGSDDKNKDKDKQEQQKKEEQKKQEQQKQQQQQQEQKEQLSDQAAEQLLNSAQQDEKNVQQKVKVNPQRRRSLEKDW